MRIWVAAVALMVIAACQPATPAEMMMSQVELEQQEMELPQPVPGVICGDTPAHFFPHLHNILLLGTPDITWVDLSAEERVRFLKAFNASPPASNLAGDNVRIYQKDDVKKMFLVITEGPCVLSAAEVSAFLIAHWFRGKEIPVVKPPSKGI